MDLCRIGFISSILFIILVSCSTSKKEASYTPPTPTNKSGEELAKLYCSSCHQYPEPSLLPKKIWKDGVLPKMAYRLGMANFFDLNFELSPEDFKAIAEANIYPINPVIAQEDWKKIQEFYLTNSPENPFPQSKKEQIFTNFSQFKLHFIPETNENPLTTLVKFSPKEKKIYIGSRRNLLEIFDLKRNELNSIKLPSPPSDIQFFNQKLAVLTMGIMDPNDQKKGKLLLNNQTLLDTLRRPVELTIADLNQDQQPDWLICQYGNEIGKLAWYESGSLKEHILKPISGARNLIISDLNKDNLPDIVVLMAQAREGISVFYNRGKGNFEEEILLEFPPVYGSSFMQLADFNADGFQDILYTNGDNADFSQCPKAYHGIRIFLNNGKNQFKESYFYPMFGATKTVAADFDSDGDLDLAAIAYFPENNSENFVLLENQGNLRFKPFTFKESQQNRWLTLDVNDMDADGDQDLILGAFQMNLPQKTSQKLYKAIVLENLKK